MIAGIAITALAVLILALALLFRRDDEKNSKGSSGAPSGDTSAGRPANRK